MGAALWYAVSVSLAVGVAIAALRVLLFFGGRVPELEEGRRDILFHIASELSAVSPSDHTDRLNIGIIFRSR